MTAKWVSFILLFLCTLGLGVLATDLNARPVSAVLICGLYLVAYILNSFIYGLELFRKEQRLLNRVGYHGLVFFRGSQIESSEREKAEKLFIRQANQGGMGRFVIGAVVLLCLGVVAVIRKKAPDQLQLSTLIHFISIAILACSFSMNHYFLSLAINACAVFIFISQRVQDPKFHFFQEPTGVLCLVYIIFVFGFTGVFYRFLEFFQFGIELKNVRRLMRQGWLSGILFLASFFLFNGLVPDPQSKGRGDPDAKAESKKGSLQLAQTVDRMMAQALYGKSEANRTTVATTTTTSEASSRGSGPEEKIVQGLKKSLERQVAEMDALKAQREEVERRLEALKAAPLGGDSPEVRQQKVQELHQKIQDIQSELMGKENRVADLRKHLKDKGALPNDGNEVVPGGTNPMSDHGGKPVGEEPSIASSGGIDPEKEKREMEELRRKIAELEAAQERSRAEAEARQLAGGSGESDPASAQGLVQESPEEKAAKLEAERRTNEELARMKEALAKKEELVRAAENARPQSARGEQAAQAPPEPERKRPDVVTAPIEPAPKTRILSDAQLEMILKLVKVLFLGGLLIALAFGVIYFLNRNVAKEKERNLYQAQVEDPERFKKELRFLDQKGLSPQQEVILKYNLFLRFLRSVDLPKEDWQTVDQFNEVLSSRKNFDSAELKGLGEIFGKVCYGGYRPGNEEVQGFRSSVDRLVTDLTAQFKKELLVVGTSDGPGEPQSRSN